MATLVLENISKTFSAAAGTRVSAVRNLNLAFCQNEFLVLTGPSGCGKTTLLRLIAGLEKPDSGTVSLDGFVLNDVPAKNRDVAMVFQSPALLPNLNVYDNIALGLQLRRFPKSEIENRVSEAAKVLKLTDKLRQKPEALSGGEAQRVSLGRALVRSPKILLLDEPLSQLDAPTRRQLRREILDLHEKLQIPAIYVTHDQREALGLNKRVAVMNDGEIQQIGSAEEIRHRPANPFVAEFFDDAL